MAFRILSFLWLSVIVFQGQAQNLESKSYDDYLFSKKLAHYKKSDAGNNYDVAYHRLELRIDPRQKNMQGVVTTYLIPKFNDLDDIKFDFSDSMQVDSVLYHGMRVSHNHTKNILSITPTNALLKDILDSIHVFYHGDPTNNPHRSYERETGRAMSNKPSIWTLSQPYGAYEWWPCKQGLTDKIDSLDLLVTVPKGNRAAGNGILVDTVTHDSMITFHWKHRYPIATYLVATAVTDYVEFTDWVHFSDGDSLPIVNYTFPESKPFMEEPVKQTIPIMQLFDSLVGEYPFMKEKYGHAEFLRGGGMEHQTMSFMGSWNFGLIAHELAHQWFGDQITCGSWSDLWLNEGFATYFTLVAREHLNEYSVWYENMLASRDRAMREPDKSVFVDGSDTLDRERLFSNHLTYNKGAQLLRMLQWYLGDSLFYRGLRNYLADPSIRYGFARADDLKFHLEATARTNLQEFFNDWYYGTGHPTYNVVWKQKGRFVTIHVSQTTNGSTDFFDIPVELRFIGRQDSTSLIINPNDTSYQITTEVDFIVDSIRFDPDLWVLAEHDVRSVNDVTNDILIYPNPASNRITVSVLGTPFNSYSVFDISGREVISKDFREQSSLLMDIDLNGLTNGMYILQFSGENTTAEARFVKY